MASLSVPALNIAELLRANALEWPEKKAIVYPAGTDHEGRTVYAHKTFRHVDQESDAMARGFTKAGITKGTKTILMVKPSPELFSITLALIKVGAVPVVVDPGMGITRMLHCYKAVGADAFVGIPIAHVVRVLSPSTFSTLRTAVTVGRRLGWGGHSLDDIAEPSAEPLPITPATSDDLLIVNFTTGSTGPAKGVEYTHANVHAMLRRIRAQYGHGPDDVALAPLPLFALFHLLIGATAILPPMDPTKPALADAKKMIDAIRTFRVDMMFASPAFLRRVGRYAEERGITLPSLQEVVAGGAPVTASIVGCFKKALSPRARLHTTYGATEALPISSIESSEILGETSAMTRLGQGTCVGMPLDELALRIVRISDEPIAAWSDDLVVKQGEVGEITIAGPIVSRRYHATPEANTLMKIADGARTWHRTGDLGFIDEKGRVWFCGRKSQRVTSARGPLFTVQWEGIFNAHPDVYRTALVGVGPAGAQEAVVCVELRKEETLEECARIERELGEIAAAHPLTQGIKAFLIHPGFPVDIRHNAKIGREELAAWAAEAIERPRGSTGSGRARDSLLLVPILGWLFILYGLIFPFENVALRAIFWVDILLSVGVHGLQLSLSLPAGKRAGYSTPKIVLYTFLFGATWWKFLEPGR
jgi:acyl-CoA synthetase (AMP-forming)/AMP-acid ligase II